MFEKITPEQAGVHSANILRLMNVFKKKNYSMHSVVMAHKGKIFFEQHWAPYNVDSMHRLYSASKSFVSLAIGFLYDEGKIRLDDKIIKYFPEYEEKAALYLKEQTICDMLKMSTASVDKHWMGLGVKNRTEYYFTRAQNRPSGTLYNYDSTGTYILAVVVERVSGKDFIDYLKEKLFRKIGVSEDICCLKTPEGYSWADSGIRCKIMDFLKVAQFATNMGNWNGEQLLSREYMTQATSFQTFTGVYGYSGGYNQYGYGYQFWKTRDDGFSFNGMANQYAICVPQKDFVFVCTADNQFNPTSAETIFENVFDKIVDDISDDELPENPTDYDELKSACSDLKLPWVKGNTYSEFQESINGISYELEDNDMKITGFKLNFYENDEGSFEFTDEEGKHVLPFGLDKNVFFKFPKNAMPDEVGSVDVEGYRHECAASGAWVEDRKFFIKAQIIDKYLANLCITIGFKGKEVGIQIIPNAEFFLAKYCGYAGGKANEI